MRNVRTARATSKQLSNSNKTSVKSVDKEKSKWSGSVSNSLGSAQVTVNSVSGLFSRSLAMKARTKA